MKNLLLTDPLWHAVPWGEPSKPESGWKEEGEFKHECNNKN